MSGREFVGLSGGAAAAWPHAGRAAPLPDAAAEAPVQQEGQNFPLVIASMPATAQHRTMAVGVFVLLIVAAAIVAPFASIQVARVDAFIPVLQTVVCVVDLITAVLLFAQFSIQPQPALLALASAYIFSGSFAFLQTLAFPGGYAPAGLIGDGPNTPAWIYVLWHTTFPAAILAYALAKDKIGAAKLAVLDTAAAFTAFCKLWDGTTVIASATGTTNGANFVLPMALSGVLTSPAGNIRISCRDASATTGKIVFNNSANSKDSTITAVRIQ